jgi:hypothetical protein
MEKSSPSIANNSSATQEIVIFQNKPIYHGEKILVPVPTP